MITLCKLNSIDENFTQILDEEILNDFTPKAYHLKTPFPMLKSL